MHKSDKSASRMNFLRLSVMKGMSTKSRCLICNEKFGERASSCKRESQLVGGLSRFEMNVGAERASSPRKSV